LISQAYARNRISNSLIQIPGIISVTYNPAKGLCIVRKKRNVDDNLFGTSIAKLGYEVSIMRRSRTKDWVSLNRITITQIVTKSIRIYLKYQVILLQNYICFRFSFLSGLKLKIRHVKKIFPSTYRKKMKSLLWVRMQFPSLESKQEKMKHRCSVLLEISSHVHFFGRGFQIKLIFYASTQYFMSDLIVLRYF